MTEAAMQTMFRDYLQKNPPKKTETYELKICRGTSLPFDAVQDHQIRSLNSVWSGFFYKITDPPIFIGGKMRFNVPRPFDCMYFSGVHGFVVVWFYKPRKPKIFIKIPIIDFLILKKKSVRKSMTEEMALSVGVKLEL